MKKTIITLAFPLLFFIQPCLAMNQDEIVQEKQIPLIHKAVEDEDKTELLQLIAKGVSLNRRDGRQQTALHRAVRIGNREIVHTLLSQGAEPSLQDADGNTPMHIAAEMSAILTAISLLTHDFNVVVDIRNAKGEAPIHIAARKNDPCLLALLLQAGASPDLKREDGVTAYEIAAQNGNNDIMLALKKASSAAKEELETGTVRGYARQGVFRATTAIMNDPQIQQGIMRGFLRVSRGALLLAWKGVETTETYVQSKCEIL